VLWYYACSPFEYFEAMKMKPRRILLFIFVILIGGIIACQSSLPANRLTTSSTGIEVNARFREFYEQLGGKNVLHLPISPLFPHDGREYQYTAAVLMVYNPIALKGQQYYLAPIGAEMGISEAVTSPGSPGGHAIHSGFVELYEGLGGINVIGVPQTSVRYNEERGGIEQFFQNAGFFQLEGDPENQIQLIHYGAWMCAESCNFSFDPVFAPLLSKVVETPFALAVSRLNPIFTGQPLTEPYIAADGQIEQIFENVVVVSAPDRPAGIALRPITAMLGVQVQLENQFEIPQHFMDFISQNSGLEFSGPSVSVYGKQSDEVFRQCFTNLCLDYYPNKSDDLQVRLTPLGYIYKGRFYQETGVTPTPSSVNSYTVKASKGYSLVAPSKSQIIIVSVFEGHAPILGSEPKVTLMLPGGAIQNYQMQPTNSEGRSSIELDPISAAHGTRVDYRVCVTAQTGDAICIDDNFLIWGSP